MTYPNSYREKPGAGYNGAFKVVDLMTPTQIADSLATSTDGDVIWTDMLAALTATGSSVAVWPKGTFTFASTITISTQMTLKGEPSGTWFFWPNDVPGMIITAGGTRLEGVGLYSSSTIVAEGTDPNAHGLVLKGQKIVVTNVIVTFFGGNGINIDGTATNANQCSLIHCSSSRNRGHGLYAAGTDANACYILGLDTTGNGGRGVWDYSLLGNLYEGCHSSANGWYLAQVSHNGELYQAGTTIEDDTTVEPLITMTTWNDPWKWKSTGGVSTYWPAWDSGHPYLYCPNYYSKTTVGWSTFIGPYSEEGDSPNWFNVKDTVHGGDLGGGTLNGSTIIGDQVRNGLRFRVFDDEGGTYKPLNELYVCQPSVVPNYLLFAHTYADDTVDYLSVHHPESVGSYPGNTIFQSSFFDAQTPLGFVGLKGFPSGAFGRAKVDLTEGEVFFPDGMYVGSVANGRKETAGIAKPTWTGVHGDYHRHTDAAAGEPIGWYCMADLYWTEDSILVDDRV